MDVELCGLLMRTPPNLSFRSFFPLDVVEFAINTGCHDTAYYTEEITDSRRWREARGRLEGDCVQIYAFSGLVSYSTSTRLFESLEARSEIVCPAHFNEPLAATLERRQRAFPCEWSSNHKTEESLMRVGFFGHAVIAQAASQKRRLCFGALL